MIGKEFSIFLIFILLGMVISFLFDFFRILRHVYVTPDFVTIIEDILFWIISGIILLSGIFILNEGTIRAYLFIALFIGIIIYIISFSKIITKIGISILKSINKLLFHPLSIFFHKIHKLLTKILLFFKKIINSTYLKLKKIRK